MSFEAREGNLKVREQTEVKTDPEFYFSKLKSFDRNFSQINFSLHGFESAAKDEQAIILKNIAGNLDVLLESPKLSDHLPANIKAYFEHDAKAPRDSLLTHLGFLSMQVTDPENGQLDLESIRRLWTGVVSLWQAYVYIFEDLVLRMGREGEKEIDKRFVEKDRNVEIKPLLQAIQELAANNSGTQNRVVLEISPSYEDLEAVRLSIPHGTIYNSLRGYVMNALHRDIGAEHLKIKLLLEGRNLVFEVWDDGRGMPEEMYTNPDSPSYIFQKGVTVGKKGGTGMGLAYAKERFGTAGCDLQVKSRVNPSPGQGDLVTVFRLTVPTITH
ncbi:MAG TPA: ATP-binding protein [Patescibacteria group bacterium]|nr:ATP-binding protein [Patescibacteria group bacterium]